MENDIIEEDDIDKAISIIDSKNEVEETKKQSTDAVPAARNDEFSVDSLTKVVLDSVKDVNNKGDELYDMFYTPIALGKDRSDASKIAILDVLHAKNESVANVAQLINAKARLLQAQNAQSAKVGVIVNAKSGDEVGINLSNLDSE